MKTSGEKNPKTNFCGLLDSISFFSFLKQDFPYFPTFSPLQTPSPIEAVHQFLLKKKKLLYGLFGIQHLESSWNRKFSHYLMTQNIEVLFSFPRRKNVGPFVSFFSLFFNHPELVVSTVLKKAHVEIYFQELNFEWTLCFPLKGLRAPYTHIWGVGRGWSSKCQLEPEVSPHISGSSP